MLLLQQCHRCQMAGSSSFLPVFSLVHLASSTEVQPWGERSPQGCQYCPRALKIRSLRAQSSCQHGCLPAGTPSLAAHTRVTWIVSADSSRSKGWWEEHQNLPSLLNVHLSRREADTSFPSTDMFFKKMRESNQLTGKWDRCRPWDPVLRDRYRFKSATPFYWKKKNVL